MSRFYLLLPFIMSVLSYAAQYDIIDGLDEEGSELDPAELEEESCPPIDHLKNITLKALLGQWHLPYMSKHYIHHLAGPSHKKYMEKASMGQTCIKINIKEIIHSKTTNSTNKPATIWIQSKCPRTGSEFNLACAPMDNVNSKWLCSDPAGHTEETFVYVVDTDGKSWALIVRCFPENGMNWAIFSKVKQLPKSVVKSALNKVEQLGFKIKNVIEIPYSKCITEPELKFEAS